MTADHTPERLREAIERVLREHWPESGGQASHAVAVAAQVRCVDAILAAHLADVEARLAKVEALLTAEGQNDATRARTARAALHPDPTEAT